MTDREQQRRLVLEAEATIRELAAELGGLHGAKEAFQAGVQRLEQAKTALDASVSDARAAAESVKGATTIASQLVVAREEQVIVELHKLLPLLHQEVTRLTAIRDDQRTLKIEEQSRQLRIIVIATSLLTLTAIASVIALLLYR